MCFAYMACTRESVRLFFALGCQIAAITEHGNAPTALRACHGVLSITC